MLSICRNSSSDSVIEDLRSQRKALVVEYQEKLETFKPSYPVMVQINNKIKEIDQQLAAEVQAIKGSLKAAYEASLAQENDMKARIETLRQESSRSSEPQHSVQYFEARGRHQPRALREPAAALQGG